MSTPRAQSATTASSPRPDLPQRARVVVIGGGVIGTSVAYHLAHEGERDVVLLERDRLTSGTTWHAAGLMTCFGSFSETSTRLRLDSRDLYARLEAETGLATGFRPVGLIEAAADSDRLEEYRRVAAFQRHLGLEVEEIGPRDIAEAFPLARTDDLLAGFWVPGDGRVNPVDLTMSLARGASLLGVQIIQGTPVEQVLTRGGQVVGVRTPRGDIECERVVVCTGMWTRELAGASGVVVPGQAAEHYYLVTEPFAGVDPTWPVFEDPAAYGYYREEGGGLMVGLFEPVARPWALDGVPADFSFGTLPPDTDRVLPYLETAMARVPVTQEVGIRTLFCGPETFTPDLAPAVGEAPGLRGYFVAAGLNSVGVLSAGGLGRIVAHWVATGRPDVDVSGIDVARFRPEQLERTLRAARTAEILGTAYAAHTPGTQLTTGRGRHTSPVLDRLVAQGGALRDVSGWEGAAWFAGPGERPQVTPSWGEAPWHRHWEAEHRAVREAVGLIDMSFMTQVEVSGPGAAALLTRLSTADVAGVVGRLTYTQWLGPDGGIEADVTVTRLAAERFLVVISDTARGHALAWLERHRGGTQVCGGDGLAEVTEVTEVTEVSGRRALLSLQGPRSRAVLAALTDADVSAEAFAFRDAREITVAGVPVLAVRVSYVGELGWELSVPAGEAGEVYDALLAAGAPHGIRPVGLAALSSLRLEVGYRDWGHDIDATDDLVGAGVAFTADLGHAFVGREAFVARRAQGVPPARLVSVVALDPAVHLHHGEVLLRDGVDVGYVRAGAYGWSVGGAVGLAHVTRSDGPADAPWLESGRWELDVAGRRVTARVSARAPRQS